MNHHNCRHGNRDCSPSSLCTPCGGGNNVLRDGEQVRRPMMMMDSVQRELAARMPNVSIADNIRAQARADHEAWKLGQGTATNDSHQMLDAHYRDVLDAKVRQLPAQLRDLADQRAQINAHAERFSAQFAARDAAARATPRDRAHAEYCERLDYRGRG